MNFECESKAPISEPEDIQIRRAIAGLKSYGKSTFASITDEQGNYVQVLGGGVTCLLEYFNAETTVRLRGVTNVANPVFPDGTVLVVRGQHIPMRSDEWFRFDLVADVFCAFRARRAFPFDVQWRPAPGF
ncbi:hypothetical protein ACQ859_23515 [Roseateles chitinivorans]|uniref:hypothetical protein n=1 Tax=Roseateles chitinivorans TaxID=2917965 RepID=UPI003D667500